jgi:predicted MFS family arabinose efflux permease
MISGLAFMSHQLGSFLGAFGGGVLFDSFGNYDIAWRFAVGMGLMAGVIQITCAVARPPRVATA